MISRFLRQSFTNLFDSISHPSRILVQFTWLSFMLRALNQYTWGNSLCLHTHSLNWVPLRILAILMCTFFVIFIPILCFIGKIYSELKGRQNWMESSICDGMTEFYRYEIKRLLILSSRSGAKNAGWNEEECGNLQEFWNL